MEGPPITYGVRFSIKSDANVPLFDIHFANSRKRCDIFPNSVIPSLLRQSSLDLIFRLYFHLLTYRCQYFWLNGMRYA